MRAGMAEERPGHDSDALPTVVGHLGRELGIVIAGSAQLIYGGEEHDIQAGDTLSFFSQIPHVIKNISDEIFQAYWIVTPADGEDYFGDKS